MNIINLIVLAFLFIFPGLNFMHYAPVADWWTNALVVFGGALAAFWLVWRSRSDDAFSVAEFFVLLFFSVNAIVGYFISINSGSVNLLIGCMVVLLVLSRFFHVQASLDRSQFILQIAQIVFLGGLLQVVIGFVQVLGLAPLMHGYVMYDAANPAGNIMGNIAQRNLYGHYLAWAMFSASYLYLRGFLRFPIMLLAQFAFSLVIAWSGGRLILGYVAASIVWGLVWYFRSGRDNFIKQAMVSLFLILIVVLFVQIFIEQINGALMWLGIKIDLQSGMGRIFDHGFGARRRIEWSKAWILFREHPWVGVGWDGYAAAGNMLELHAGLPKIPESWLFAHCHNLFFQILAETGLLGFLILLTGLCVLIFPFFLLRNATSDNLFLILLLTVTFIHSMFEFPLWYLPFLAMLILVCSLSPLSTFHLKIRSAMWRGVYGIFFIFCISYVLIGVSRFNILTRESTPTADVSLNAERIEKLSVMRFDPLWGDDASFALARFLSPSRDHLALKLDIYDGLLRYRPQPFIVQNGAMLYALAGNEMKAVDLIKQFIVVYPDQVLPLCFYLDQQSDMAYAPLRSLADKACMISLKYPGTINDERRRLAIVNAFAAPVTRKPLF